MLGELEMLWVLCFLPHEDNNVGTSPVTFGMKKCLRAMPSFLFLFSPTSHEEAKRRGDAGTAGPTEVAMGTPATCATSLRMLRRS